MKTDTIEFKKVLKKEANNIGIELNESQLKNFELYKDLLIEWNKVMNLTSITNEYEIIMKHFIDCLEVTKYISQNDRIIDIGTGAGFPGLVIAIFFENKSRITLVDSLNKRINFLKEVVDKLGLDNVELIHARAEELAFKEEYRQQYDIVVSRAVANLSVLLEYDIPYLKIGKKALFLKGDNVNNEIQEAKKAFEVLNCKISNIYNYKYNVNKEIYNRFKSIIALT